MAYLRHVAQDQGPGPRSRKARSALAVAVRKDADPGEVERLRHEYYRIRAEEQLEAAQARLAELQAAG
jgi:hypothetical protein